MWPMAALLAVLLVIFVVVLAGRDANASSTKCKWVEHVLDGQTNETASAAEKTARETGIDQLERLSQPSDVIRIVRRTDHGAETCTIELASSEPTPTPARRAAG